MALPRPRPSTSRWSEARFRVALALAFALAPASAAEKRSGFDEMSAETQAMQRDDASNPGMLAAGDGEDLWTETPAGGKSCASCHGEARETMKGVAARYPAFDEASGGPMDLQERIRLCDARRRPGGAPLERESDDLVALETYVGLQSRGMSIAPDGDPRLTPFRERGEALFKRRIGQLDLSCAQCHDARAGGRLAGALIPQGHPNGYPLYRLEWQGMGSLQRRLRNCMTGVRAEAYPYGAREFVELELYLKSRAAPLAVETPAVRP